MKTIITETIEGKSCGNAFPKYKEPVAKNILFLHGKLKFLGQMWMLLLQLDAVRRIVYKGHIRFPSLQKFCESVSKNKFNIRHKAALSANVPRSRDVVCSEKDPEQYGWQKLRHGLDASVRTTSEAVPDTILKSISCKCKEGCAGACACRKSA